LEAKLSEFAGMGPARRKNMGLQVCDSIQSCKVSEIILGFGMMKPVNHK
jgi:hypothetical protein